MYARESISNIMITNVNPQRLHLDFRVSYICQAIEWPNQNNAPRMQLYHAKQKKKNRKEKKNNENKEGKKEDAKEKREDAE
jgi:hypothetical protein